MRTVFPEADIKYGNKQLYPTVLVGCNYLFRPLISASSTTVFIRELIVLQDFISTAMTLSSETNLPLVERRPAASNYLSNTVICNSRSHSNIRHGLKKNDDSCLPANFCISSLSLYLNDTYALYNNLFLDTNPLFFISTYQRLHVTICYAPFTFES